MKTNNPGFTFSLHQHFNCFVDVTYIQCFLYPQPQLFWVTATLLSMPLFKILWGGNWVRFISPDICFWFGGWMHLSDFRRHCHFSRNMRCCSILWKLHDFDWIDWWFAVSYLAYLVYFSSRYTPCHLISYMCSGAK